MPLTGDFTPSAFTFAPQWDKRPGNKDLSQPRFTTADYLRLFRPDAKFIIMLRDPVERYVSCPPLHGIHSFFDILYACLKDVLPY